MKISFLLVRFFFSFSFKTFRFILLYQFRKFSLYFQLSRRSSKTRLFFVKKNATPVPRWRSTRRIERNRFNIGWNNLSRTIPILFSSVKKARLTYPFLFERRLARSCSLLIFPGYKLCFCFFIGRDFIERTNGPWTKTTTSSSSLGPEGDCQEWRHPPERGDARIYCVRDSNGPCSISRLVPLFPFSLTSNTAFRYSIVPAIFPVEYLLIEIICTYGNRCTIVSLKNVPIVGQMLRVLIFLPRAQTNNNSRCDFPHVRWISCIS